jgi:hypothetical protein
MPVKGPSQNPALKMIRDAAKKAMPNLGAPAPARADSLATKIAKADADIARLRRFVDESR